MSESGPKFSCAACQRSYTWKPELAGKRGKCKCGQVLSVPQEPPQPDPPQDDLYDLADVPPVPVTKAPQTVMRPALAAGASGVPLEYQRAPTAREIERSLSNTLIDPRRDVHVPFAMIAAGVILYLSYYAIHYNLGATGMIAASVGLTIITLIETTLLVGFALVIAGPLGVGFGGVGTTILKLAAIVVFCDGLTTWIDGLAVKFLGPLASGIFGFGVIGLPIAILVYFTCLIYLFSMDPGDARMIVAILAVLYRIIRIALVILLLRLVLGLGGVSGSSVQIPVTPAASAAAAANTSELTDEIEGAKAAGNLLMEARQYIKDRGRGAELGHVNDWYSAGAKNVWYQVTRDINQHDTPFRVVVELPDDKLARAKCYTILKSWCDDYKIPYDLSELIDTGEQYMIVPLPFHF
jgi:hypothetical protein